MTDTIQTGTTPAEATEAVVYIPLNKLKKHPLNARKKPHSEASIEAKAASIHAKGILQNLVVEPERKASGEPTGCYLVTIGEGRRQAQLLRVKRRQIKKTEPIRCVIDTVNDPSEISLDENVNRENLHPADEYERFHELSVSKGWGAEEIGARFGRTPEFVKRRMRLGAVSPKLLDIYRQDGITLDQLMAFTLTDDHARQEKVFENLSYNKEPWIIRRDLTAGKVPATDRRAVFVGADAYEEAGGTILRDLIEDHGGWFEDAVLLDTLVVERLREIATELLAEGWKWAEASIDFPHAHGLRRYYPQHFALSDEDEARLSEAAEEHDALTAGYDSDDELPEDVAAKVAALSDEIDAISAKRYAYDPDVIAHGGVFVSLGSNGEVRIERGFVRAEDEPQPEAEAEDEDAIEAEDGEAAQQAEAEDEEDEGDADAPLPDGLVRDLTAHRTLGLRLALGERTDVAMVALTHALVVDLFYQGARQSCLDIGAGSDALDNHAPGISATGAAEALCARHDQWGAQLPSDPADLWACIAALDSDSRTALLAHCVSLTVDAVKVPWDRSVAHIAAADVLARAVDLDMAANWTATKDNYFGRVTKAHIAEAVSEAVSPEVADRIRSKPQAEMAEAAEQLVAGTGWLPAMLRMPEPEAEQPAEDEDAGIAEPAEAEAPDTEAEDGEAAYSEAAE